MLTTLAVLAVVQAAPGELKLVDPRLTYGVLGPTRVDDKLLPGDNLVIAFDVKGMKVGADGKVQYSTAIEVLDKDGKTIFRRPPQDLETINALGGGDVPAYAQFDIGLDAPPGEYTLKVTVTDRAANASQSFSKKVTVLPKGFGVIRLNVSGDAEGRVPVGLTTSGETVYVNFAAAHFDRDKTTKQPKLEMEMRVLDDKGNPTLSKPFTGTIDKDVPANAPATPGQFLLSLNRAGRFTVEVKVTDKVTGKSSTVSCPLVVVETK